jgi:hypothetical protein
MVAALEVRKLAGVSGVNVVLFPLFTKPHILTPPLNGLQPM